MQERVEGKGGVGGDKRGGEGRDGGGREGRGRRGEGRRGQERRGERGSRMTPVNMLGQPTFTAH